MDNYFIARENMIKSQVLPNKTTDSKVVRQMAEIPRHLFVPEHFKNVAYVDDSIALGGDRYLMSGVILSRMIQALHISQNDVVLDVASGAGYSAAVLSGLAKNVIAIESDQELAAKANSVLKKLDISNVLVLNNKIADGHPEGAPYNVIIINGAVKSTPHHLIDQLAEGGRLITGFNDSYYHGVIAMFTRKEGKVSRTDLFDAVLDVLPDFEVEEPE
ncbi:MAG: protein-L-isoaspartate O-methyltransferase [Rickettsiaceae bacterium]|jgi:protein-L-isoaspartate(D-aspartate) O-methyltransferase|nr:protein-L-isoaspartate O-methyltransferase [Rickettsiaceae bacterium]